MVRTNRMFKYDVLRLIELVENRPCLWDKTIDAYNDKLFKQKAWKEICASLEDGFHQLKKKDQQIIGKHVSVKWQNIRDSYVKSLKRRTAQGPCRKYIYHENLQFLQKITQKDDLNATEDSMDLPNETQQHKMKKRLRWRPGSAPDEDEAFFMSVTPTVRRMCEEDKLEFRMGVLQLIKEINCRGRGVPSVCQVSTPFSICNSDLVDAKTEIQHLLQSD